MNFFRNVGTGLGVAGHFLGLPELGLSEKLAGLGGNKAYNQSNPTPVDPGNTARNTAYNYFANKSAGAPTRAAAPNPIVSPSDSPALAGSLNYLPSVSQSQSARPTQPVGGSRTPTQPMQTMDQGVMGTPQSSTPDVFNAPLSEPKYISFNGSVYDINDPGQLQAFNSARQDYAKQILGQASGEYGSQLGSINADLSNLSQQEQDAQSQYNTGVKGLNEAYDTGTANRSNYFAQLSPNAFQSSQGDSQQYANNQRLEGLGQFDQTLNQNKQGIATNRALVEQDRNQLADAYNQFTGNVQQNLGADPGSYTQPNSIGEFSYDRQAPVNSQINSVDLSQYTPYLNFDQLAQSPAANYFQNASGPFNQGNLSAKDSYLGYTPSTKEKDYLNQYLRKGY